MLSQVNVSFTTGVDVVVYDFGPTVTVFTLFVTLAFTVIVLPASVIPRSLTLMVRTSFVKFEYE